MANKLNGCHVSLSERSIIIRPKALFQDAVRDLEECPEQSSRVEDAVRLTLSMSAFRGKADILNSLANVR